MAALNAIETVLSILIMVSVGCILTWKRWFSDDTAKLFSKIVVNVSLPAYMISNIMSTFTRDKLLQSGAGIIVPFLVIGLSYIISIGFAVILRVEKRQRGVFQVMFAFSNTIFIGLPVNTALFGDLSIPYVLFYYIANTTLFWTIGTYGLNLDGSRGNTSSLFSKDTLKRILTPPLIGFAFAVILVLAGISLPKFVMDSCKYIGNLTTPLSMLFIGIIIYNAGLKGFRFNKAALGIFLGRFLITPMLVFLFVGVFQITDLMKNVFIIQSALPIMTQTAIMAKAYGADDKFAATMATLTTVASLVSLPIYMYILS